MNDYKLLDSPTVELVLDDANASRFTQKRRRDSDNLTPRRGTEFNATPPPTTMGDRGTPPSSRYAAEIAAPSHAATPLHAVTHINKAHTGA